MWMGEGKGRKNRDFWLAEEGGEIAIGIGVDLQSGVSDPGYSFIKIGDYHVWGQTGGLLGEAGVFISLLIPG